MDATAEPKAEPKAAEPTAEWELVENAIAVDSWMELVLGLQVLAFRRRMWGHFGQHLKALKAASGDQSDRWANGIEGLAFRRKWWGKEGQKLQHIKAPSFLFPPSLLLRPSLVIMVIQWRGEGEGPGAGWSLDGLQPLRPAAAGSPEP